MMTKSEVEYSEQWCRSKIAELEAQVAELTKVNVLLGGATDALGAELAKLREAADRVAFEAEADDWSCMPSIQACKKLAAALEVDDAN